MASAGLMLLAVMVIPIRIVGNLASLFSLLGFVIVNLSVIRLRRQQPDLRRPFEIPYYPIPPILGIVFNLLLGLFIDPVTWALAISWLVLGGAIYWALSRRGQIGARDEEVAEAPEIAEPEPDVPTDTQDTHD
jgi:amino acid transporter